MQIDWWTLALQTINLLVLVWLLGRFLFRPVARIVRERQEAVQQTLDDAKAMRDEAQDAKQVATQASAALAAERDQTLAKAQDEAAKEKQRLVTQARSEAAKVVEDAQRQIEHMREDEAKENAKRASDLAVDIAARVLHRLPDEARVEGFIGGLEDALAELPQSVRKRIGEDGSPVTVVTALPLTDGQSQACREAISGAIGREPEMVFTVRPEVIAGIELETPFTVVRNSFQADLERIRGELTADDTANA